MNNSSLSSVICCEAALTHLSNGSGTNLSRNRSRSGTSSSSGNGVLTVAPNITVAVLLEVTVTGRMPVAS